MARPPHLDFPLLVAGANAVSPGASPKALRGKLKFLMEFARLKNQFHEFFSRPENDALLQEVVAQPKMLGFVVWPYIHAGWSALQRFEALSQHQRAIGSDIAALALKPDDLLEIADMSSVSPGLRLVVDRAPWCLREGSLVFNQFLNEERMMSIAFSFGERGGERVAYVGSVQGSHIDSALEKYREIAKGLQGMRSRDFLIKAFQFMTFHLGVKRLLCVSEAQRHHQHPFFRKSKMDKLHLNYDEIWTEHGGEPGSDGFFELGRLPIVRAMDTIAAKNRPLYRRRYALMDQLSRDIASRFADHTDDVGKRVTHGVTR